MKIGLSIYSLYKAVRAGEMTPAEAIGLIADYGADIVELVGFVIGYGGDESVNRSIKDAIAKRGLEVSAYSIFSDILDKEGDELKREYDRIAAQMAVARSFGANIMRTDLTKWGRPPETNTPACFERDMPKLVEICGNIADIASEFGLIMTVENHGTYINNSERVSRLILAVNRDNFKCTLDVGNCLCVDEDPLVCVKNLLPYAATIHFKDFCIRKDPTACGADGPARFAVGEWLTTNYGRYIKGTIVGDGDVDVVRIMKVIKESGYSGSVAVEFEGMEDCRTGAMISLANVKRYAEM